MYRHRDILPCLSAFDQGTQSVTSIEIYSRPSRLLGGLYKNGLARLRTRLELRRIRWHSVD